MPRLRERKRLREQRIMGIRTGIPKYVPAQLETRGFKLKFYDLSDVKIGEIGSDVKEGRISEVNFELLPLGCGAFSFVIDDLPKQTEYTTEKLLNGDFEGSELFHPPAYWTAGNQALLTSESGGKSGQCMKILENGAMNPYACQDFAVIPERQYRAECFIKKGTEASYFFIIHDVTNDSNLYAKFGEAAVDWSTKEWAIVTAPKGCVLMRIICMQQCLASSGTYLYFDECSCKESERVNAFDIEYRTRVDIHPYFDPTPWFTGFIQNLPQPGQERPYVYTGFGFYEQLDWVLVTGSYESQDIALIVKDIIENTVAPNTQIIYNASKVETTGYVVTKIDFDHVYAKDAIQTLADMAQGFEFGVDDSREFYFRAIDTDFNYSYWVGKHCQDIQIEKEPHSIRNKLFIKMGEIQAEGSNIIGSVQDNASISTYGLREEIVTAPEAIDSDDAIQWAQQILAQKKDPKIKAKIKNVIFDTTKTKMTASGKTRITTYEGTEYQLFIKKINYSISSAGILGDIELE